MIKVSELRGLSSLYKPGKVGKWVLFRTYRKAGLNLEFSPVRPSLDF